MLSLLICGALGWVAIMLSLSKGAFLAGVSSFVLMFVLVAVFSRGYRVRALKFAAVWLGLTIFFQLGFSYLMTVPSTVDYISGKADATRSTSSMRVFTWRIAEKMAYDNLLIGVGADNFGFRFNESRLAYARQHPTDTDLEIGEDFMFERAHNEPLQVLTELGVIGLTLFMMPFAIFAYWTARTIWQRRNIPPVFLACVAGMTGFLMSSLVSSFSFRAIQNGLAFAIVFGLALRYLRRAGTQTQGRDPRPAGIDLLRTAKLATVGGLVLAGAFIFLSGAAGVSRLYQLRAQTTESSGQQATLLRNAIEWDDENAAAHSDYAMVLAGERDFDAAIRELRRSIDCGAGATQVYSILANLQTQAGEMPSAAKTMAEAVAIYPRSVFARVRYAQMLELEGNHSAVEIQIAAAKKIDQKQSNGWIALIRDGDAAAFQASLKDDTITPPADLRPYIAVFQFVDREALARALNR